MKFWLASRKTHTTYRNETMGSRPLGVFYRFYT